MKIYTLQINYLVISLQRSQGKNPGKMKLDFVNLLSSDICYLGNYFGSRHIKA